MHGTAQSVRTYDLGLEGVHQAQNAGAALAALYAQNNFVFDGDTLAQGLKNVVWPGRLQRWSDPSFLNLFPKGSEVWLDGAHNQSGAQVLFHYAKTHWRSNDKPLVLIVGLKDKTKKTHWHIFNELTSQIHFVSDTKDLSHLDWTAPARFLITGSLHFVGSILSRARKIT